MNNNNNEKKRNLSDIEPKIAKNSKDFILSMKKAKLLSDINFDKNNVFTKKSKVPDIWNFSNKEEKKENKKWFDKEQKLKKMNKNKTDGLLNKNHKENKINNNKKIKSSKKESLKANKKNNSEKMITNRKETSNNINSDSIKNFKKRYKKSLTETIKDEKEKSEKGNDSESCIIEGDSEYGDSEAFKL